MALIDGVEHLRGALDYHLSRHNLLAANLANLDTPGYASVDLERRTSFSSVMRVALETTHPGHVGVGAGRGHAGSAEFRVVKTGMGGGADGNGVDLDREAVRIASNQVRYDVLAQLASSELASLAWAANDGRQA